MDRIKREKEDLERAIEKIEAEGTYSIIEMATKKFTEGFNSIVFYNPESDNFSVENWTSGTRLAPNSRLVEVYRISENIIANNSWAIGHIVSEKEYEELKAAVAAKENLTDNEDVEYMTDFLDPDQLAMIDIDSNERFAEYLLWEEIHRHEDIDMLGLLKRELADY